MAHMAVQSNTCTLRTLM